MTRFIAALVLTTVLGTTSPACAEWFAGAYLGFAMTSDTELTFTRRVPRTWQDVEFQTAPVWGARAGYWFEGDQFGEFTRYIGADLDVSYFRPRIPTQTQQTEIGAQRLGGMDVSVVTISPSVLVRFPLLADQEFPQGRLQPYVAFGPTFFVTSAEDSGTFGGPGGGSESDSGLGVTFRLGLSWAFTDALSVFSEYRLVHLSPTYEFTRGPVDFDITSHQLNFGIAYRFGR